MSGRLRIAIIIICSGLTAGAVAGEASLSKGSSGAAPQRQNQKQRPLSLAQVEQLISNNIPDNTISGEIRKRGIDFRLSRAVLNGLRNRGAGEQTIQALSVFLPKASLSVFSSPPECHIYLNNQYRALTDTDGRVVIPDLDPGRYKVTVRKKKFRDAEYTVDLVADNRQQLTASLEIDPEYLRDLMTNARSAYVSERYSDAVPSAKEFLTYQPSNTDALVLLAQSYFMMDDIDNFKMAATQALNQGGAIEIPLQHFDGKGNTPLHAAKFVILAGTLIYDAQASGATNCLYRSFQVSMKSLSFLNVVALAPDDIYLSFKMPDITNTKKILQFWFADRRAYVIKKNRGGSKNGPSQNLATVSRPIATHSLRAVKEIMEAAKYASSTATTPPSDQPSSIGLSPRSSGIYRSASNLYQINYPSSWETHSTGGEAVTIAPRGAVTDNEVKQGVLIAYSDLPERLRGPGSLREVFKLIAQQITKTNTYLKQEGTPAYISPVNEQATLAGYLAGRAKQNYNERVWLVVRPAKQGVLYLIFVAPATDFTKLHPEFRSILYSLSVNE
jgi:Carboxypeptidase regulatory-like domain